jgi:hypothetical protein
LQLAPDTFIHQPDHSYLLSEDLFIDQGAALQLLSTDGPLQLRLQSNANGFTSIVSFGGTLDFEGTSSSPVSITSYDPSTGSPDRLVTDGRAYIRSIGGTVTMNYVHVSDLGFWSGRTGGVAITGNNRPHVGLLGPQAAATKTYGKSQHLGHSALKKGAASPGIPVTPSTTVPPAPPPGNGAIQPAGKINSGQQAAPVGNEFQFVGGSVRNSTFDGNAFGLFLSGARNFLVTDSSFTHSLYAGLVLHRYVTGALIQRDTATNNGADGIDVTRAANSVQLLQDVSSHNAGIGFSLNGNPLASTESTAGMPVQPYGNHLLANGIADGNGVAGAEVSGGMNVTVQSTEVRNSPMGIVVRGSATNVRITTNLLSHLSKHGLSIRDGVTGALLSGNTIDGAATGIYIRNSQAQVTHNTVQGGQSHAVSLVGRVGATSITNNVFTGVGNGAVDAYRVRSSSVTISGNDTSRWIDLRTWTRHLKQLLSPLTLLWLALVALIAFTAVRGRRQQSPGHPYANSLPLKAPSRATPDESSWPTTRPVTVPAILRSEDSPSLWVPWSIDLRDRGELSASSSAVNGGHSAESPA